MGRKYGSRNRTKIPNASEIVKYSAQSLREGIRYLDSIISSQDPSVTIKNKMDAIKQIKEILDMAGYGKELEAGKDKIISQEGEQNSFRPVPESNTPQKPAPVKEEETVSEEKTPVLTGLLTRYEGP